ncbi:NAD(P)/FAD-dependent oxidoreductase [Natrononativus amylolyticus]|uniref:NAD(P)/FAD-dependent oxidoreductase n=1 Tax=Natrononativus amylolyticus TaxID=2963434 RepID=UPI0020CEB20C|nr:FAD-dependent oxidoreductase [Natrononativus amylolyticus]
MNDAYEAVVVGGGIVGASAAYHLVRDGVETLLVDRDDEGRATDAGAGIVSPATSSRTASGPWFGLAVDAFEYYPTLVARLEAAGERETSFSRPGLLAVAVDEDETAPLSNSLERIDERKRRLANPAPGSVESLEPPAASARLPGLAPVRRAFHYADAARIDGRRFADATRRAAEDAGLDVENGDVADLTVANGSVRAVELADGRTIGADRVVVTGGAWSPAFADRLDVEIPVEPQRGQIAHLRHPELPTGEWPIVKGFRGHYVVPWSDGRVAVGATRESGSGYASRTTAAGVREVLEEALRLIPALGDAELREVRVGLRPASPDGLPILGAVPGIEGAYLATGHGPTGLTLGPYSGKLIAELVRGEAPSSGLEPFAPERFA